MMNVGIGMGYVDPRYAVPGTEIKIQIRNNQAGAVTVKPPIYKKA
jgi:glycine cleavage system aminomethyltransferase T